MQLPPSRKLSPKTLIITRKRFVDALSRRSGHGAVPIATYLMDITWKQRTGSFSYYGLTTFSKSTYCWNWHMPSIYKFPIYRFVRLWLECWKSWCQSCWRWPSTDLIRDLSLSLLRLRQIGGVDIPWFADRPPLLFWKLGSLDVDTLLYRCLNTELTIMVGTSGCGKTREIFERGWRRWAWIIM